MARGDVTYGVRAPLFDRLSGRLGSSPGDPPRSLRILDRAALRESLQRELQRLLNTRAADFGIQTPTGAGRSVIDYGLPDYSAMYTENPEDQKKIANLIRTTIETYEPRIKDVKVEAKILGNSEKALQISLFGNVMIGRQFERMAFSLSVTDADRKDGSVGR